MPSQPPLRLILTALSLLLLAACGDASEVARQSRIVPDPSVTVAEALARYPFFTDVTWSERPKPSGGVIVEAACELNVRALCRRISPAALDLATKDVARDLVLVRLVVDGLPRRARPLEALHVTECKSGKRLVIADPKLLRAIYNREELPFFCLEGLNCAGQ
jgi:hypothetical protein